MVWRDFSKFEGMKKFYHRHSVKKCTKYPFDNRAHLKTVRRLWFSTFDRLETWLILSGTIRSKQYHESTMVLRNLPSYHLWLCLLLLCHALLEEKDKTKYQKQLYGGSLHQTMVDSCNCLDWVVPEGMSQVWRRSEVGNHKQRTLNTWRACASVFISVETMTVFHTVQWLNDQIRHDFVLEWLTRQTFFRGNWAITIQIVHRFQWKLVH